MAKPKSHYTDNPAIYIDDYGIPRLNIFRHFYHEPDLPKFKPLTKDKDLKSVMNALADTESKAASSDDTDDTIMTANSYTSSRSSSSSWNYERSIADAIRNAPQKNFLQRAFDIFKKKKTVDETFDEIKSNLKYPTTPDLEEAKQTAVKLLEVLKKSGQYGQAQKVESYIKVLTEEIVLIKNDFNKYLLEEDVIDFLLKAEKGVNIAFLRHFSNILPLEVAKKKMEVDNLLVFDNYVVMFYDTSIKPFRQIIDQQDRVKAADPILFGVIEDSNKLYYITDWVYKEDDLTMEKVENMIGRKSRYLKDAEINNTQISFNTALNILVDNTDINITSTP